MVVVAHLKTIVWTPSMYIQSFIMVGVHWDCDKWHQHDDDENEDESEYMEDDDDDDEDDDDDRFNLNESVDGLVGVIGLRRRCRSATSLAWKVDSRIKKRTRWGHQPQ